MRKASPIREVPPVNTSGATHWEPHPFASGFERFVSQLPPRSCFSVSSAPPPAQRRQPPCGESSCRRTSQVSAAALATLHKAGLNALIVDPASITDPERRRLAAATRRNGLLFLLPRKAAPAALAKVCRVRAARRVAQLRRRCGIAQSRRAPGKAECGGLRRPPTLDARPTEVPARGQDQDPDRRSGQSPGQSA